eukprot:580720-Amphidinium_carterae.1
MVSVATTPFSDSFSGWQLQWVRSSPQSCIVLGEQHEMAGIRLRKVLLDKLLIRLGALNKNHFNQTTVLPPCHSLQLSNRIEFVAMELPFH